MGSNSNDWVGPFTGATSGTLNKEMFHLLGSFTIPVMQHEISRAEVDSSLCLYKLYSLLFLGSLPLATGQMFYLL